MLGCFPVLSHIHTHSRHHTPTETIVEAHTYLQQLWVNDEGGGVEDVSIKEAISMHGGSVSVWTEGECDFIILLWNCRRPWSGLMGITF